MLAVAAVIAVLVLIAMRPLLQVVFRVTMIIALSFIILALFQDIAHQVLHG